MSESERSHWNKPHPMSLSCWFHFLIEKRKKSRMIELRERNCVQWIALSNLSVCIFRLRYNKVQSYWNSHIKEKKISFTLSLSLSRMHIVYLNLQAPNLFQVKSFHSISHSIDVISVDSKLLDFFLSTFLILRQIFWSKNTFFDDLQLNRFHFIA